jgi:hypothetical protein
MQFPSGAVHPDIGWLDVLVNKPAFVNSAKRDRNADGQRQERRYSHRSAEEKAQWLTAGILKQQDCAPTFAQKL